MPDDLTMREHLEAIRDRNPSDTMPLTHADAVAALAALDQAPHALGSDEEEMIDSRNIFDPVRVPATRNETRDTWNFDERVPGAREESEHLDIHQADIGFGLRDYCDKCGEEWPCPQYRRAATRNEEKPT